MREKFYLYILANIHNTVLYIGTTYILSKRVYEHKIGVGSKFVNKYNLTKLVYYEYSEDMYTILHRERLMKKWKRSWKENLISEYNPGWKDLFHTIL